MPLGNNELRAKLKAALKAIENAPVSTQRRPEISELKDALTLAIQALAIPPGPSPVPTN